MDLLLKYAIYAKLIQALSAKLLISAKTENSVVHYKEECIRSECKSHKMAHFSAGSHRTSLLLDLVFHYMKRPRGQFSTMLSFANGEYLPKLQQRGYSSLLLHVY